MIAVFDQTNNAIHLAQYANCGSKEREITSELDLGSIKGDCEAPNLASGSNSNPLSGTDADNGAGTDSSAPSVRCLGLDKWLIILATALITGIGLEFLS